MIQKDKKTYILFQHYAILEAIYESPFYWFLEDPIYKSKANKHRGDFTEDFSAETLSKVFGKNNVFQNIDIYDNKKRIGEIDVLVVFANRAIVLQAKSKKLTLGARKGNDKLLANDFKKAIQDSYEQGNDCAKFIQNKKYYLIDSSNQKLSIRSDFKEIYIFCVVSEHYPSLAFQTQQFLQYEETDVIKPPFVMDIFLLDVMVEMLNNPLYFLSYLNKRTTQFQKFMAQSELTILSYHLKRNLYLEDDISMMMIDDDVSSDLDLALLVRKKGIPGKDTPDGILTKFNGTILGNFIDKIKQHEDNYAVEIGFFLLTLSEEAIIQINEGIQKTIDLFLKDNKGHDFTVGFDDASAGLTIHTNDLQYDEAYIKLLEHCKLRKYKQQANNWFGLCINPLNKKFRFGVMSNKEWNYSKDMGKHVVEQIKSSKAKIGRNEKCPCGSGKKYKKCCL
ncbi:MAG: SEC-C metal-binding domain-containing protein [Arcobacteraceae bacterium]